jgi:Family of unknown function (DUF6573)
MKRTDKPLSLEDIFGPVIVSYTRAQALEDGVLVDASPLAKEAGFQWPVALTRAVWEDCVTWTEDDNRRQAYQDQTGRLWDLLFMAAMTIRAHKGKGNQLSLTLCRVPRDGRSTQAEDVTLKILVVPGDHGEPVITILWPQED